MGGALTRTPPSIEPHLEGLQVRSLIGGPDRPASHVIACGRTQAAAVIDPTPENRAGIRRLLEGRKLRFELHTSFDGGYARARARLDSLSSGIGLAPKAARRDWLGEGRVRVAPTGEMSGGCFVLSIGDRRVSVGLGRVGMTYTVRGAPSMDLKADRVRLALGAWHVGVFPLFWRDGFTIAYSASGRVWFGGMLRSPGAQAKPHDRVLPLDSVPWDDDTLLFPSLVRGGICVGTMRQEKIVSAAEGGRLSGTFSGQDLDELAGVDNLLTPVPPAGLDAAGSHRRAIKSDPPSP